MHHHDVVSQAAAGVVHLVSDILLPTFDMVWRDVWCQALVQSTPMDFQLLASNVFFIMAHAPCSIYSYNWLCNPYRRLVLEIIEHQRISLITICNRNK